MSQESVPIKESSCSKHEILLTRAEEIAGRNFRFNPISLTEEETLLHVFQLVCGDPSCEEPDCGRGVYKAVSKDCHKDLDESDMCMLFIEFPNPVNFI